MNRHTIRVLEFETVRAEIREYCLTTEGSERLRRERVLTNTEEVDSLLAKSRALRACLEGTAEFPSLAFPEIETTLARLEKEGVVLEAEALCAISLFSRSSLALREYLETAEEPELEVLTDAVPDSREIGTRIARFIDDQGEIRERDIPVLKSIRSQISRAQHDLQREAQSLLSRDDLRRYWNSAVPTQREGRTVLALKADHRGKVKGIIHEVSSTGATVFLEPEKLVERNNAVTEAQSRYHAELMKILRDLTTFVRQHRGLLQDCLSAVLEIDRIYARARYAMTHECIAAGRDGSRIMLRDARHPMLGSSAVPISVEFPDEKRLIVVTGPNTGGKTVSLKTVGLLALMNQFGLEVPAGPGTVLPVFTGIFADIGDEQSIEQNLSTFSGHMRNIARILSAADDHSLVLLDELGSGTDPEEGGALAMAILDELLARGPHCVITTHHGSLKHYGFTQPAAANASMEFDTRSLRPTYRIVPGVPGSSHAIEVAAHMGLLRTVTKSARNYLQGEEYDTGRIIRTLTDREQELHREREEVKKLEHRFRTREREIENRVRELEDREADLRLQKVRELEQWGAEARSQLENLVREIREGELTREKTRKVKEFVHRTGSDMEAARPAETKPPAQATNPAGLSVGDTVRLTSSGATGVILRRAKADRWQVQVGNVKLDISPDDLVLTEKQAKEAPEVVVSGIAAKASLELDLRGYRLEDALDEVERQIDQAVLSGLNRFGVIHGTGEGVLQKGVRDLLRRSPHVAGYEFARPEDGGYGKTVVELK